MFQIASLLSALNCGKLTLIRLNGRNHCLSSAEDLSVTETACSGTLRGVAFTLECAVKKNRTVLTLTLCNTSSKTLILGDVTLFSHKESPAGREIPAGNRSVFAFNDSLSSLNYVYKAVDQGGIHTSHPMCLIYDLAAGMSFFSAQMAFEKNAVRYRMRFDRRKGFLKELLCVMSVPDYELSPGEIVSFDPVAIENRVDQTPKQVLRQWAEELRDLYKIKIPEKIPAGFLCGWLISTKAEKTDSQIRRNMRASSGTLRKLGVEYVWTSIDNLSDGLPGNWLLSNTDNFKNGVEAFLKEITENGFIPGLWMAPFLIVEGSSDLERVRGHLLRDRKDNAVSLRFRWFWGQKDADGLLPPVYCLDSDREESFAYIKEVLETYARWGVRYYMMDFLGAAIHGKEDQTKCFCLESYRRFLRKLSSFCTKDTFLLCTANSSLELIGAFASSRIGLDYGEARQLEDTFESYPANYVINGSFGSSGAPNRNAVQNLAMWSFAHGNFFSCNSNVMTVDKPVPLNEAQISATLFGMSPSPVFFQDDFERMSPDRLALVKKVLPRCPGMPEAVDLFTRTNVEQDFVRIFVLHIRKAWGSWSVCAVFNLNDSFRRVKLSAEELGLAPDREYFLYEFWDECYKGSFRNESMAEIPAMSCKVFRIAEKKDHPWVLSTDLHVRQGDAELQSVHWDAESMTLSGEVRYAAGERGNLLLVAPENFREKHFNKGMLVAKSAYDRSLIIKLPLFFEKDICKWKVEFALCSGPGIPEDQKGEILDEEE